MTQPAILTIGPDTTVAEAIGSHPRAREALVARGIDTCCGGSLSLRDAAELRGVDLASLLEAVGGGAPPAEAPLIGRGDSVRAVLASHPGTVRVFEKHGLMGCGGSAGPDERIDLFATIHRLDVAALLGELNEAASRPLDVGDAPESIVLASDDVYRPFLRAALWSTLTLGATFGAYNLLAIHWALGVVPPAHNWAHAGVQLWGFLLLFIMGVSYHALPRFLGTELPSPATARRSFGAALAGLVLATYGRFGAFVPAAAPALLAGAALQMVALVAWAGLLLATYRRGRPAPDAFQRFLAAGTLWWLVAGALQLAGAVQAYRWGEADIASGWNQAVYAAVLYGGALCYILGMFLRVGPVFLDLAPARGWLVTSALVLSQAGALLGTAGLAGIGDLRIADAGLLATAASLVCFVVGVRPWSGKGSHVPGADRAFVPLVKLSFACGLLFALLAAVYAATELSGTPGERLLLDGARHAFTLGFVTVMIFAMAGRILPVFGGSELRLPWAYRLGGLLIGIGVLLREAQVVVVLLKDARLMTVSGLSGIVAATGVALASASILATIRAAARPAREEDAGSSHDVELAGTANVAALVTAHPEAIPVLVAAGFAPIANPVLRRTVARAVTLEQACRMHHIDLASLLVRLREACPRATPAAAPPPLALPVLAMNAAAVEEETVAPPLRSLGRPVDAAMVKDALRDVIDPELGLDVVDLGLIYDLRVGPAGDVAIRMTLTSRGCPHGAAMADKVERMAIALPGVRSVNVDVVFDPPWSPDLMSESARVELGMGR